jgi:hypothetical protein
MWDFGALGPAEQLFERVDHRHLDDPLPGRPAPCQDLLQLLADYLQDQLAAQADLPFVHLIGAYRWCMPGRTPASPTWQSTARPMRVHAPHRLEIYPRPQVSEPAWPWLPDRRWD